MRIKTIVVCASILSGLSGFAQNENASVESLSSGDINISIKAEDICIKEKKAASMDKKLTADDFVGKYVWNGFGAVEYIGFSEEGIWHNGGCLSIIKDPENDDLLIIKDFDKYGDLKDCYVENNRLYIPNQLVGYDEDYEANIWFHNAAFKLGNEKKSYKLTPLTDCLFYFMLTDDNELVARSTDIDIDRLNSYSYTDEEIEDLMCAALDAIIFENWLPTFSFNELFWFCALIEGVPLENNFTFNEDEWVSAGNATFKDAWLPFVWENGKTPSYEVPLYRDKSDDYRFLLKDPYGSNTPYGDKGCNLSEREGYIIFNIEDPNHVYFEPYIYGGTIQTEGLDSQNPVAFYPCNTEGLYAYSWGHYPSDIRIKNSIPSTFSEGSRVISINNACYSYEVDSAMIDHCFWDEYNMDGYIVLPRTYNEIREVIQDFSDCPIEYYNLQGVRIENPEKGQLVIVRQGDKSTKQIMR